MQNQFRPKVPVLPANHKVVTMGIMANGERVAYFKGSCWSVMDLRATFAGIPKFGLVKPLKGMVDILGWRQGLVVLTARGKGRGNVR